jgi:hypothetical protein
MDWRNIAKKMQSLGPGFGGCPNAAEPQQRAHSMTILKSFCLHLALKLHLFFAFGGSTLAI